MGRRRLNVVQKAIYDAMLRYAESGSFGPDALSMSVTNAVLNASDHRIVAYDEKLALALGWREVRQYADGYVHQLYDAGVHNGALLRPEDVRI